MNNTTTLNLSDEHVVLFLRKLKHDLNCSCTGKIIAQVRQTLLKVKNFSTPDIAGKVPPLLHMVLMGNRHRTNQSQVTHLDELADSLYKEDKQAGHGLFTSEVHALGIAVVILKRIQDLFTQAGLQVFPYVLSNEINQAAIEEAV